MERCAPSCKVETTRSGPANAFVSGATAISRASRTEGAIPTPVVDRED